MMTFYERCMTVSGWLPPGVTDRDIDNAAQHARHEYCVKTPHIRCGCYLGNEQCKPWGEGE